MRKDKLTNERYFLEDYLEATLNTHLNMSKLHDALKNFGSENIFNEESSVRKTSKENKESINVLPNIEEEINIREDEENNRNDILYESSENSLDGWDEDDLESNYRVRFNRNSTISDLFLI